MKAKNVMGVRNLAALERAKAMGLPIGGTGMSAFERQAREWKRREEARESKAKGLMPEVENDKQSTRSIKQDGLIVDRISSRFSAEAQHPASSIQHPASSSQHPRKRGISVPLQQVSNKSAPLQPASNTNPGFDWKPYQSEQGEGKKKVANMNTASIALMARKIMKREWAMALGRGGGLESEQAAIERGVAEFQKKKAAEKERHALEEQRARKQETAIEESLRSFGRDLLKTPVPVSPETAETLLKEALCEVGDCIRIAWQPDGCGIFIEPWEEKRLRRKRGDALPALLKATIDDNLMLTSYQKVEDPRVLQETCTHSILNDTLLSFRKSAGNDLHALEDAVAEKGRIIQSIILNGRWKVKFEPWEEVRKRNIALKRRAPIVTYVINADKDFKHISCDRI